MTFEESIEYLYGLGNEVSAMKLGLENITILLDALGSPQKKYKKVQIAGTNGKGSTCAFLEAICVSAGINVGLTTSPHLIAITERVKIGGKAISNDDFARFATRIREQSEKLVAEKKLETVPTFFEQTTAIALNAFAAVKIDLAILETGLGGRFDATTAARAEIAAIAPVDFDHEKILGNTLREIASEKAAIIREDTKVVVAAQKAEALDEILRRCAVVGVAPISTDFPCEIRGNENGKIIVDFQTAKAEYKGVKLNLRGRHQIENAKTAILLAENLQPQFGITKENIICGLQTAIHKGRLEFCGNFLLDGAHNTSGARALKDFLDEFVDQPVTLVFGAMNDKDLRSIADTLFPFVDKIVFTKPSNSRSLETSVLISFLPESFDGRKVFQAETIREALKIAGKVAAKKDVICVAGSLYLVGEARKELASNCAE